MKPITLLLGLAVTAHAADIMVVETETARIELHQKAGDCVGQARQALYVPADGSAPIRGCWISNSRAVQIAWRDGDVSMVPLAAFKPPRGT